MNQQSWEYEFHWRLCLEFLAGVALSEVKATKLPKSWSKNVSNFKAAWQLLQERYSRIFSCRCESKRKTYLVDVMAKEKSSKESSEDVPAEDISVQLPKERIRNAEEFVCLDYLAFIQNVLGRLRTLVMSILALFLSSTFCLSSYPFDPRQVLSAVLVVLFVALGIVIVKVYAEMHRDSTLSHVTNTKPGRLGSEFWIKLLAFGFAPILGLLTRIFPGAGDVIFSWVQPNISSLR